MCIHLCAQAYVYTLVCTVCVYMFVRKGMCLDISVYSMCIYVYVYKHVYTACVYMFVFTACVKMCAKACIYMFV